MGAGAGLEAAYSIPKNLRHLERFSWPRPSEGACGVPDGSPEALRSDSRSSPKPPRADLQTEEASESRASAAFRMLLRTRNTPFWRPRRR
jgi:hypothetical protein